MPYANFAAMNRTMNNAQMADAKIGMIYALQNLTRTVMILTIPQTGMILTIQVGAIHSL